MTFKGIDVSHFQGNIDFTKVKADGIEFVFVKASQGNTYVDPMFNANHDNASKAGLKVGAYHYGTFSTVDEAKIEAQHFLNTIKGKIFTYPLALDIEENKKGASKAALTDAVIAFLEILEGAGYFAMLYSGKSFFEASLDIGRLTPYALWLARYGPTLGVTAGIWQYASDGKVNGITGNVDMDIAYNDYTFMSPKVKVSVPAPPVAAPVPPKPAPAVIVPPKPVVPSVAVPAPVVAPIPKPVAPIPTPTITTGTLTSASIITPPPLPTYSVVVDGKIILRTNVMPTQVQIIKN